METETPALPPRVLHHTTRQQYAAGSDVIDSESQDALACRAKVILLPVRPAMPVGKLTALIVVVLQC